MALRGVPGIAGVMLQGATIRILISSQQLALKIGQELYARTATSRWVFARGERVLGNDGTRSCVCRSQACGPNPEYTGPCVEYLSDAYPKWLVHRSLQPAVDGRRMCVSLFGFISALIVFSFSGHACGNVLVQNHCTKVVTNSCKLRWSHESQDFYVVSSDVEKDGWDSPGIAGNGSAEGKTWCISNPEEETVQIRFALQTDGTAAEFRNCPVKDNRLCKSVCLAIDVSKQTRMINGKPVVVNYVTVSIPREVNAQNDTNFETWTTHRTSYPGPLSDNSSTGSPTSSPSQQFASRRRRSKRRCGKRCRERRILFKRLAKDFLFELTKQARKLSASNYSSLTRLLRQNSKLSSQIDKLRHYDAHFKRAILTYPTYAKSPHISDESLKNNDSGRKDEKRFKRDPGNRPAYFSDPYFCGAVSYQNDQSKLESTNRPSKVIDEISGRWTAPSFPFTLSARKSSILLDVTNFSTLAPAVLERLEISIHVLQPVNVTRRDTDPRVTTLVNLSSLSSPSDNMTRPNATSVKSAAAAVGGGFAVLLVSVVIAILCIQKRKQRLWWMKSKARRCECPSISESENCLSTTDSVEDKPSMTGSNDQVWSGSDKNYVADNNTITLEVKKSTRGRNKPKGSNNSSLSNTKSTTKVSNSSSCQHTTTSRGSSRHDHCCIVCQIAGKPHKPVMNAQHYASQVLTSAERHTQGAVGATLNDKCLNRDGAHYNSNGSRNSTMSFPATVRMPDGEERFKVRRGNESSLMTQRGSFNVCIKPPPNRTIYSCEPLPFNNNGIMRSTTPPSLTTKSHKPLEHLPTGRLPPAYSNDISNGSNNSRSAIRGNGCVCRYLMTHMDDPPPEYSDVVS